MKTIARIAAFFAALALCAAAQAAGVVTGVVSRVLPTNVGLVYYEMTGTPTGTPSCASGFPIRFSVNGTTAAGASLQREMSMAFVLNKTITVVGTNTCVLNGAVEDLSYADIPT